MQIYVDSFLHMSNTKNARTANDLPASEGFWMVDRLDGAILLTMEDVRANDLSLSDFYRYGTFKGQKMVWVAKYPTIFLDPENHGAKDTTVYEAGTGAFLLSYGDKSLKELVSEIKEL